MAKAFSDTRNKQPHNGDLPPVVGERRRVRDWVSQAVFICSITGWVFAIVTLLCLEKARPPQENIFTRLLGATINPYWDRGWLQAVLVDLCLVFLVCFVGFLFNTMRHKRQTDRYNKSILFLGCCSIVGIFAFLMEFGNVFA